MATTVAPTGDPGPRRSPERFAWVPIPAFLILFVIARWIDPHTSFEPRLLLPTLNIVCITGVCLLVSALAARTYMAGESPAVLLLGCGTLAFGAGGVVAGAGVLFAVPTNTTVTVANLTSLLAGGWFACSAVAAVAGRGPGGPGTVLPRSRVGVIVGYSIVLAAIGVTIALALDGMLPPFFVGGSGPTLVRQVVVGTSVAMFLLAASLFRLQKRPSPFIEWYSLALLLVAVGLAGFFGQRAVGSLLGWSARAAEYAGCLYMFLAVQSLPRSTRYRRLLLDQKLRETERRHRSLVDVCPDAIVVHADGKFVFANPAAARLFGAASVTELIGRNALDLVHPDSRALEARRIARLRGGEVTDLQAMQFLRLDGAIIDVEVTGARVQFRGRPAIQKVVRDVSARRRAEEALKLQSDLAIALLRATDKQAIFALLADRIHAVAGGAVVAVSEFDPRAGRIIVRVLRCSAADREAVCAAFGRDPEGLSLQFPDDTRDRWVAGELTPVPGGLCELMFRQVPIAVCERLEYELGVGDVFGMACAYEQDILGTVAVITRARAPLSRRKLIESFVASAALALKRARIDDERKHLEQELRASEGLLRSVTDQTTDAVYVKDVQSRWVMANPALLRIVGQTAEDVLGLTDVEIYRDPAIGRAIVANDRQVLQSGEPIAFEEAAETSQGIRWFLSMKAPTRDASGRIVGLIGISRDITERKRMEEALREADRRKTEFIAMLSHELRNPLAPIRFALPVIAREPLGRQAAEALRVVSRQLDHMVRLVDDLLDVSRITRGLIELRRERVAVESVVGQAVESAAPLIEAGRHALAVRLPGAPIWLDADPHRVSQIITNLLTNAAKYTPPGGQITLDAGQDDDHQAVIRVVDNGIGIAPEVLGTLFEMFYQVKAPDRVQGGLGIGLALAKRLVELHGGAIEARSAGIGCGAEFVVRLPVAADVEAGQRESGPALSAGERRLKVLIVDDNRDLVDMLAIVVGGLGHDVATATDGPGALFTARTYRPDVVLLDLGLPGLGGLEVARELRAHPDTAAARLVALTGLGQAEDQRRTREAGFDHHLTKPTDPETLERLLGELAQPD